MPKPEFTLDDMLRLGAENSVLKAKVARFEKNIVLLPCTEPYALSCRTCGAKYGEPCDAGLHG